MTTSSFYSDLQTMTGNASPGRLTAVRKALATAGLYKGHGAPLTARSAAWLVYASATAPTVERAKLLQWLSEKRAFFAKLREMGETPAVDYLAELFTRHEARHDVVAVMLEKHTGALMVHDGNGFRLLTMLSDTPPPALPECYYLTAATIERISKSVAASLAAEMN